MKSRSRYQIMRSLTATLLTLFLLFPAIDASQAAEASHPLLMEGKKTLYQRVLTRLGADLRETPDEQAAVITRVPPFSIYYVYAREQINGSDWLQVGPSTQGNISGWIAAKQLVEWKQMLVGLFTKPGNRYPALFFRDKMTLTKVLESELGAGLAEHYRKQVKEKLEGDSPLVAIEPDTYIDPRENFYLLPILDHFEADDDFATKVLKVAVVNENVGKGTPTPVAESDDPMSGFKVATTFVIDTTTSMGPYIDQTRDAIRRICEKTQETEWRDRFNFSIIAFRDSLEARPELEYTWKQIAGFKDGRDCSALLKEAATAREAKISSKGFSEDAFAGINAALTELDWNPYGGRFIVLITDASARSGSNRYSSTGLNAEQLNSKAQSQGVAVLTLHLKTPAGKADHQRAASQYKRLSSWPNLKPFYYGLSAGAEQFGVEVEQLADGLISQLGSEVSSYMKGVQRRSKTSIRNLNIDQLGHAMRLAYLGRTRGTPAPEVFEGWVAERNAQDRRKLALEIRVLLTKDQLSDLQTALRQIIEAGDLTDLAPQDFFSQMRQLLIVAQRDSSALARAKTLGDPVVLGEYLEGLPYRSALTGIDQESWLAMGAGERQEVIDDIEAKIQLYQDIHDNQDLWITLDDGHTKGDAVYPIALSDLP